MRSSITLGRLFGIEFRIHVSWFIIFALVTVSLVAPRFGDVLYWLIGIMTALLLFVSVLAHELAHSLVGRANGIPVSSITLFVFGGVSLMTREAPRPVAELRMAAAGPLCSLALGILFSLLLFIPGLPRLGSELLMWLAVSNGIMAVFNLIPGFPLDGGRIFHSILWRVTRNYRLATLVAVRVGQGIGFLMIAGGITAIFLPPFGMTWVDGGWIALIGLFLNNAASGSYRQMMTGDHMRTNGAPAMSTADSFTPGSNQS